MTERALRERTAIVLVAGHVLVPVSVLVMRALGGYSFEETTTAIGLILPFFASHVTMIVNYANAMQNRYRQTDTSPIVSKLFVMVSFVFPVSLIIFMVTSVVLRAYHLVFEDFEQFKYTFAIAESLFAVYIGTSVITLFRSEHEEHESEPEEPETA